MTNAERSAKHRKTQRERILQLEKALQDILRRTNGHLEGFSPGAIRGICLSALNPDAHTES
jgi:hypothetical protein